MRPRLLPRAPPLRCRRGRRHTRAPARGARARSVTICSTRVSNKIRRSSAQRFKLIRLIKPPLRCSSVSIASTRRCAAARKAAVSVVTMSPPISSGALLARDGSPPQAATRSASPPAPPRQWRLRASASSAGTIAAMSSLSGGGQNAASPTRSGGSRTPRCKLAAARRSKAATPLRVPRRNAPGALHRLGEDLGRSHQQRARRSPTTSRTPRHARH